jgi:hypothetical protein
MVGGEGLKIEPLGLSQPFWPLKAGRLADLILRLLRGGYGDDVEMSRIRADIASLHA